MAEQLWKGRFSKAVDSRVNDFNSSIRFDQRMIAQDMRGSGVHAAMLARQGIISEQDCADILSGLASIADDLSSGALTIDPAADDQQNLRTDSLLTLLHEKDQNTIQMLRVLSEANDSLLSASEIEEIISEQDSVITQQRVQHRVITKRDSLITTPKKKGFFKRLAEVFSPSKQDSAVLVNTSLEVATDTILQPTTSKDSLQQKIRMATEEKRLQRRKTIRRTSTKYQRMNTQLTARMDSLIKQYEEEMTLRARQDAELQQEVRMRSARIIGGIAVGAVLLSAFFLILIMRDISRSNRYRQQLEVANKRAEDLLIAREKLMLAITQDYCWC
jgi:hypothetical protein